MSTQRKSGCVLSTAMAIGALLVSPASAQLEGSDTLYTMTQAVLSACGLPANYVGGGTTRGTGSMVANAQSLAPMSRWFTMAECLNGSEPDNTGQACAFALDAISIWRNTPAPGNGDILRFWDATSEGATPGA